MEKHLRLYSILLSGFVCIGFLAGCSSVTRNGTPVSRCGDEIVAAGRFIHTGTPVVLWMDPGGYDAYRVERRFSPFEKSDWKDSKAEVKTLTTPNRYGLRAKTLTPEQIEKVRGGGWDLPLLQQVVDQFVLHFDVCGTSRQCFKVLQDHRDLSVHFMLDVDGTIYQTLDLKESAWHATICNDRSIGVEIANLGAYPADETYPLADWYQKNPAGKTMLTIPERFGPDPVRTQGFVGRPARAEPAQGVIQGESLVQYDFTTQQYAALIKLTATLCQVFPQIKCDYPRDAAGKLITHKLSEEELKNYHGILGHYHIQTNKTDPGPAMQFDLLVDGARKLLPRKQPPAKLAEALRPY